MISKSEEPMSQTIVRQMTNANHSSYLYLHHILFAESIPAASSTSFASNDTPGQWHFKCTLLLSWKSRKNIVEKGTRPNGEVYSTVLVWSRGRRTPTLFRLFQSLPLDLHTSWGGGHLRHPDFPKTLGNRENP